MARETKRFNKKTRRRLARILQQCKRTTLDQHGKVKLVAGSKAFVSNPKASVVPVKRVRGKQPERHPLHNGYGPGSLAAWNQPSNPKNGKPYR